MEMLSSRSVDEDDRGTLGIFRVVGVVI